MRCFVNWMPLNTLVRPEKPNPALILGYFFGIRCVYSFQAHIFKSTAADTSRSLSILGMDLLLFPSPFSAIHLIPLKSDRFTESICVCICRHTYRYVDL